MGCLLILCAGTLIGARRFERLRARPRQIRGFIQCLASLEAQIVYAQVLLGEAFEQAALSSDEPIVRRFFEKMAEALSADRRCEVQEAFRRSKESVSEKMAITEAEWNILGFLSENLGKSDATEMAKQIALALEHLKVREVIAGDEAAQKGKLSIYMGICGALLIIVICI